jgi:hypothetical protein
MLTFVGEDCTGVAVEDPSFRMWKSDTELAAWDVTTGNIRKAPTWDDADPGVELVATPTEMSQHLSGTAACVQVTIMGLVEDDARLTFGTSSTVNVPSLQWSKFTGYVSMVASTDPDTGEVRSSPSLKIRKNGPGRVILSSIDAKSASGCGPSSQK